MVETEYGGSGDLTITVAGGDIATKGKSSDGVRAIQGGSGAVAVAMRGGSVRTTGTEAHGILASRPAGDEGQVSVAVSGGSVVAEGLSSAGVYVNGAGEAEVTVGEDARVSAAASGYGIFSNGPQDFTATVAGTVEGGIYGAGAGDHTVTVEEGGTVTGTITLAASTVAVDGAAGRVHLDRGGTVTVGDSGRITGIEGEAIRSETGSLIATVSGAATGDILALGRNGTNRVTVAKGGDVSGTVRVATPVILMDETGETGSAVTIDGAVGRVHLERGGALKVGLEGRIRGIDGEAIRSDYGDIDLLLHGKPFTYSSRIGGKIVATNGEETVRFQLSAASERQLLGDLGEPNAATDGAWDVGVVKEAGNGIRVVRAYAPRARVYEALPSVLLGMNGPSRFQDRMAAQRDSRGAWGRVEDTGGAWEAEKTETSVTHYTHRYRGAQVGMDAPVAGEDVLLGISVHRRRGAAEVKSDGEIQGGGEIDVSGSGFGVSGTWFRNDAYVDVTATATWYKSDLASRLRGPLHRDASARGYALGVEAGRRFPLAGLSGEAALTPRIGLVHSRISMPAFSDAVNARVSLNGGRSLKGRVGASVETGTTGGRKTVRIFGSLDLEHETQDETRVTVSGTEETALTAAGRTTWLRLDMGGALHWGEGRVLRGTVGYATAGAGAYGYGAGLELKLGF